MCKIISILFLVAFISGCAGINEQGFKITQRFCDLDPMARVAAQAATDSITAPNRIIIECLSD
jgi:hypothetical protein